MLNFDRSTVKHGTQSIHHDCHQWLSDSFRVHQIRFRPGLCPRPRWGAGLRGPTSKGREREGEGEMKRERKGKAWNRGPPPLSQILGSAPKSDDEYWTKI